MSSYDSVLARQIEAFFAEEGEDLFHRNMVLARQLSAMGVAVVNPILDCLFRRHEEGKLLPYAPGSPFFHLVTVVDERAQSQHAPRIAEMLAWHEVLDSIDRSTRGHLMSVLSRIGGPEVIPALRVFREALKGIHYPSFGDGPDDPSPKELNLGDQEEVARIIAACSTRHVSKQA